MAVTNTDSIAVALSVQGKPADSVNYHGQFDPFYIDFLQGAAAGDIGSTARLMILPPGKWRYLGTRSWLAISAFGAARTVSIGHNGYTKPDGTVVAAAAAAFDSAKDYSAALAGPTGYVPAGALTADGTFLFDTRTPVDIIATVAGGTIPAAATIKGQLLFMRG